MKRCDTCRLGVAGNLDRCPLCGSVLEGTASESGFPANKVRKKSMAALEILAVITVFGAVALFMAFVGGPLGLRGMVSADCALAVNFLFVRSILIHNPDFMRIVQRYFLVLIAISAIWFAIVQDTDITTYIIPSISILCLVMNAVLLIVFKGSFVQGYAKYIIFEVVLGAVPAVFLPFRLVSWPYLAYASLGLAVALTLLLLILARQQISDEIRKLMSA